MLQSMLNFLLFATMTVSNGTGSVAQHVIEETATQWQQQQVSIAVSPAVTYPGDVILVRSKQSKSVTLFSQTYHLKPSQGEYVRFIPIPFNAKPGSYMVEAADKRYSAPLEIKAKTFAIDSITVSKQMNSMRQDTNRINADQKKIEAARSQSSPVPYFTKPFIQPTTGRLTTPFGYQRVVNGVPANRHAAIDIANKEGTPIMASNDGKVVLSESIYLTGNTIIIDHGLNVFSIYAHMSKLQAEVGQEVKQGQVIGLMGTTGFSTGPHLHYGMLIGNTYVNPQPFFEASPFLWK